MMSIKARQAGVCALGHLSYTRRCIELEHICRENTLVILVPYSYFPFATYGPAPGFVYVLSLFRLPRRPPLGNAMNKQ